MSCSSLSPQAAPSRRRFVLSASAAAFAGGLAARAWAQAGQAPALAGDLTVGKISLAAADEPIRRLYDGAVGPLWTPSAAAILEAHLRRADAHALNPKPYLELIAASRSAGEHDLNLSRAALAFGEALARGVVNPAAIFEIYTLPRADDDLVAGLRAALARGQLEAWLGRLAPQDPAYLALSRAYLEFAAQADGPGPPRIGSGPLIKVGDEDARRPAILAALARQQAHGTGLLTAGLVWSLDDAAQLKVYQRSRGLAEDGVVGPNTLALLNASPRDKARRLAVNLERLRWLERTPPPTRIDVNTAASTLDYVVEGKTAWTSIVVPGRPGHETPQLQASFERLVVNPPWYVPASIARSEIIPRGAAYLRRHHMRWRSSGIVQSPGPWAALGAVKFDMQDPYAIYLHDTPSKAMFARSQRHLSHGCVRVRDAVAFARRLAKESSAVARYDRILASGRTGVVGLQAPIPVRLIYQTALVSAEGEVTFRPDVYGWDVRTAEAMGLAPPREEGVEPITAAPLGP